MSKKTFVVASCKVQKLGKKTHKRDPEDHVKGVTFECFSEN